MRHDVNFVEDKAFRRSTNFLLDDQSKEPIEAPRPSQDNKKSSIVTSTGTFLGGEDSQNMEWLV